MREGVAATEAMWALHLRVLLAQALGKTGAHDDAVVQLEDALTRIQAAGGHYYEAEAHRVGGELSQLRGEAIEDSEAAFLRALGTARTQNAKSLELRSATSLARLWHRQGRSGEARDLLAPVYNWFTEGHDTRDLVDARECLQELV